MEEEADLFSKAPDSGLKLWGDKLWFNIGETPNQQNWPQMEQAATRGRDQALLGCVLSWEFEDSVHTSESLNHSMTAKIHLFSDYEAHVTLCHLSKTMGKKDQRNSGRKNKPQRNNN